MGLDAMNRIADAADHDGRSEEVELVSFDGCLGETADVALVKIDVEGFEEDVLLGASELLGKVRPAAIVEANDRKAMARVLGGFGYRQYAYDPPTRQLNEVEWDHEVGANMLAIADLVKAQERLAPYPPGATRTHTV